MRGYDRELRNFCLFLRNPDIEQITLGNVMEHLNGMADLGWDRNSFVGKCMALRCRIPKIKNFSLALLINYPAGYKKSPSLFKSRAHGL